MADFRVGVGADTTKFTKDIKTVAEKTTVTVKVKTDGTTEKLTTTMKKTAESANSLQTSITKVNNTTGAMTTTVTNSSKAVKGLGSDFADTLGKVAKFGAVTAIIGLFTGATTEAISTTKELDSSFIELRKVTDLGGESLKQYTENAFNLAEQLSTTASNVTDAVTEFSKSGYDLQESMELGEQALVFQTIADGMVSASDSATMFIQTMKAYNMTAEESVHITDAINEVSNRYSVSSSDLSSSIGKVASVANMAGVDFEHLLGLFTGSNEIIQQAGKTANGYKTILTNLMTKDLEKQFNAFGLSMRDTNGALKDGYTIIEELSGVYKTLGETWDEDSDSMVSLNDQMNKLLEDIAGKHNINVLVAGLQNFEQAINATESAINSAGSAQEEYETALDGIAKKTEALKGAFQELTYGGGGLSTFLKVIISVTTGVLNFVNAIGGLSTILITVSVLMTTLNSKIIANLIIGTAKLAKNITVGLLGSLKNLIMAIPNAITAWQAYSNGIVTANTAIQASIPIIGLVLVAVSALTIGISAYANSTKKANEEEEQLAQQRKDSVSSLLQEISAYDTVLSKLNSESLTRDGLNSIISENLSQYSNEIGVITDLNKARQASIDKIKEEQKAKAQEVIDVGYSDYIDALEKMVSPQEFEFTSIGAGYESATSLAFVEVLKKSFNEAKETIDDFSRYESEVQDKVKYIASSENIDEYISSLQNLIKFIREAEDGEETYSDVLDKAESELSDATTKRAEYAETIANYNMVLGQTNQIYDESLGKVREMTEEESLKWQSQQKAIEQTKTYSQQIADLTSAWKALSDEIDGVQSAYSTLNGIVEEYNATGDLSLDNLQSLLALDSSYMSSLEFVNGQLKLNTSSLIDNSKALLDQAKQYVYASTMKKLDAIASADVEEANRIAKEGIDDNTDALGSQNQKLTEAIVLSYAYSSGVTHYGEKMSATQKVIADMKTQIRLVDEAVSTMGKGFVDTSDVVDKLSDSLKKLQDNYKTSISYINSQYDDQIDKINEAKDAELDSIQLRIDALEEQKNKQLEVIDSQKTALEEQKSSVESYWEDIINKYESANNELESQIELEKLQESLSKARATKVKVLGESGFEYRTDSESVTKATQDIADYERKQRYEKGLKDLEDSRDKELAVLEQKIENLKAYETKASNNYDEQIEDLKNYKDKVSNNYDSQIAMYKNYKEQFNEMVESYQNSQDKLLTEQLTGINLEDKNWMTRLSNLKNFVNNYNSVLKQLGSTSSSSSSGGSSSTSGTTSDSNKYWLYKQLGSFKDKASATANLKSSGGDDVINTDNRWVVVKWIKGFGSSGEASSSQGSYGASGIYKRYAQGSYGVKSDQIALVGENPNTQELAVGSKLNGGSIMNLKKNTGIIPHNLSSALVNMASEYMKSPQSVDNSKSSSINYTIQNMTVQANNADEFVNSITTKFKNMAIQTAY